jgi:hypothetical protein
MVKTTGAEFWAFYNDNTFWPEGAWHDDEVVRVNGEEMIDLEENNFPPEAKVEVEGGIVFLRENADEGPSFESYFKTWRKAQNTVFLSVECPKDKVDAVKAAIKAAGGKAK